jgi:hypothetical protein
MGAAGIHDGDPITMAPSHGDERELGVGGGDGHAEIYDLIWHAESLDDGEAERRRNEG